jgi:spermidine synthase
MAGAAALLGALLAFPFGALRERHLATAAARFGYPDISTIAGMREGAAETALILRTEQRIEPPYYRLMTGGFSMASSQVLDRRYMKLFVYLALAFQPEARSALLISYGIGSTAKALVDSARLERIDVVDISRDVLELSDVVFPDPAEHPLRDPRVHVTIEDGRYFLQTTERSFDLITSEPPPPKHAGVVNLYTREYFQLIHDRLTPGGVNTYWLPVHLLTLEDTKAILAGYCAAFPNCSLWGGTGYSWMLAGIREPARAVTEEAFARQWQAPEVAREMRALALERPEQLAALFMLDAAGLTRLTEGVAPLTDDRPKRLSDEIPTRADLAAYDALTSGEATARAFRESAFAARLLPAPLRERALPYFEIQGMLDLGTLLYDGERSLPERLAKLHRIQTTTPLRTLPLWLLGRRGGAGPRQAVHGRADAALAEHDFAAAEALYAEAWQEAPYDQELPPKLLYAACMNGRFRDRGFAAAACGDVRRLREAPGLLDSLRPFPGGSS